MSRLCVALVSIAAALVLAAFAAPADAATHWLCRPGMTDDPCTPGLSTTVYSTTGAKLKVEHPKADAHPLADCFYVYPTVSDEKSTLSDFKVDDVLRSIALYQAARFSQHCRIFAPTYRQVTIQTLTATGTETAAQLATGIGDVRAAFADYLAHDNHGRPFVLIGHSQGSFVLRKLIAEDVDTKPAVRARMLSAILLGGNVLVKQGSDVGGDFQHVRACHSTTQLSCVVAFSTFDARVPPDTKFGAHAPAGEEVLCTNPTALGGGAGAAKPIFPTAPFAPGSTIAAGISLLGITQPTPPTVWSRVPGGFRARCSSDSGAHVLQVAPTGPQVPKASPDATWGLHLADVNVALGNLVDLVASESRAFVAER